MSTVDIVLLIMLAIGTYRGYQSGLLLQLLGIIAFFLAIIGGFHLMYWGADFLRSYLPSYENFLPALSFIAIFLTILVLINLVGKGLKSVLDLTLLGSFDDIIGAFTGLLKWTLVLSLLIWVGETYLFISMDQYRQGSVIFPFVASVAPLVFNALGTIWPYLEDLSEAGTDYEMVFINLELLPFSLKWYQC